MAISENYILPGTIVCPDLTGNTIARDCCPAVFFAPKSAAGTAADLSVNTAVSAGSATALFGEDSPAKAMVDAYLRVNPFGELVVIPYTPTGTAATGTITLAGTATAAGLVQVFVGNTLLQIDVMTGDTETDIATDVAAAVNANTALPVTATSAAGVVTLTAKLPGNQSNMIQFVSSITSEGVTVADAQMAGGAGAPDYAALLAAMGDCCCYDFVAILDNDQANMDVVRGVYADRWGCECFVGGRYYNTFRGTFTETATYLEDRKGEHPFGSTLHICPEDPSTDYEKLATMIGRAHLQTCADPAKTWYKLELTGAPNIDVDGCADSCLTTAERNILAFRGAMTTVNGPNGFQIIESDTGLGGINADDEVDLFLRYPQAAYQVMQFARLFKVWAERFDGLKISNTEVAARVRETVLTPNLFRAEYKAFLRGLEGTLIENVEAAEELVTFSQNTTNPSRADVTVYMDPISAFRQFAVTLKPRINLQELV